MANIPSEFRSEAQADNEFDQPWNVTSGASKTICAIPAEFGGQGGGFSPEDLFLQAAVNCFVGTFKVVAKLSKLSFSKIHVIGNLIVDKNDQGKVVMKSVHLDISIFDVDRPDRLQNIVAKSIRDGFVLNSIRSELSYTLK